MADRDAVETGRRQARAVLEARGARRAARRARGERVLIAEGDSWFDYPFSDVLKELEDEHGFEVESVSHKGDTIEQMAYSGGQLDDFVRTLEKTIRIGRMPEAILLSGGGNDVAGEEFAVLLNHADSPTPGLNDAVVQGILQDRVRHAYITVLSAVTSVCEQELGRAIPILIHGYDHAVPDGRGFAGGWSFLPGPWLEPGFREKGYEDEQTQRDIVEQLIDRFNDQLLSALPGVEGLGHVRYVDLRGTLRRDATYREWWANELHPTKKGYRAVAATLAGVLGP